MLSVDLQQVAVAVYMTILTGVLASLVVRTASNLEVSLRSEIKEVQEEISQLRSEMGIMRSDLTHVALALGSRPRAAGEDT